MASSCYDKLRKAANSTAADASRASKLENLSSRRISEVLPNLFLSGRTVAQNFELLKDHRITTVINVSDREIPLYPPVDSPVTTYRFYPMSDTPDAKFGEILEESLRIIHRTRLRGEGVLVHCFLGVSRSATLVAFYLIAMLEMKWSEAIDFVRQRRSSISPNVGFLHQLKVFSSSKSKEARHRLTSPNCLPMRRSDGVVIRTYLPLAVLHF